MGTKNIARTAIEGGRYWGNTADRNWSHREDRAELREWVGRVMVDEAHAEESAPARRRPVRKQFHDKLAVPARWLWSHVGRPWDDVYAKIRAGFDTRTTAGRHIVFDHLMHWIVPPTAVHQQGYGKHLTVDADGILVEGPKPAKRVRRWALAPGKRRWKQKELDHWAKARRVGCQGGILFWCVPTAGGPKPCQNPDCQHRVKEPYWSSTLVHPKEHARFRQHHRLTPADVRTWHTIEQDDQQKLWHALTR